MSSWIKMRKGLARDAAVTSIGVECGMDRFAVVGRLHAVWSYFDDESTDGTIRIPVKDARLCNAFVTVKEIDSVTDCEGFARAMVNAGWLVVSQGDGFEEATLPHFERHNSQTAKERALTALRVRGHRARACNDCVTAQPLPEKRREEKNKDSLSTLSHADASPNAVQPVGGNGTQRARRTPRLPLQAPAPIAPAVEKPSRVDPPPYPEPEQGFWDLSDDERAQIDAAMVRVCGKPYAHKSSNLRRDVAGVLEKNGFAAVLAGLNWAAEQARGSEDHSVGAALAHAKTLVGGRGYAAAKGATQKKVNEEHALSSDTKKLLGLED